MAAAVELVPQLSPFVRQWENFNPNAYKDGTQTSIGYGTRALPGETTITRDEAERRMQAELTAAAQYVDSIPGSDRLTDDQRKALTDQAYNAGGFGTGLRQAIASGSPQDVAYWMGQYRGTSQPGTEAGVSNRVDARLQLAQGNWQGDGSQAAPQPAQVAMAPPMPNMRPTLASSSSFQTNDFGGAPPLPTQLASYNTSTPQAPSQPLVDDLGGNGKSSPLHQYNVYEPSNVMAGPYGADKLVQAAISGDVNAFNKALGDLTGSAAKDALMPKALGGIGMDGVQQKLQGYFDQLQQQSPGAVRAMQTAYNSNPQLAAAVPPQLQGSLQDAFKALPAQSTGQVPLPNLRPSSTPQADTPPPPMPQGGPTMVNQTSVADLPPKDAPAFPQGWTPTDSGDQGAFDDIAYKTGPSLASQQALMQFGNPSPQYTPAQYAPPPTVYSVPPAYNSSPAGNALLGFGGMAPSSSFLPARPSASTQLFNQFASLPPMPTVAQSWLPKGVTGQPAAPRAVAAAPSPQPPPLPQLSPAQQFMQQAGPAPQNVNWQATLAPDPDAQPGTDNTYVLNDLGYGGGDLGGPGFNAFVYG